MSPIKGIEIQIAIREWSFVFGFNIIGRPEILFIAIGPIGVSINKPQYWRNGILDFTIV